MFVLPLFFVLLVLRLLRGGETNALSFNFKSIKVLNINGQKGYIAISFKAEQEETKWERVGER